MTHSQWNKTNQMRHSFNEKRPKRLRASLPKKSNQKNKMEEGNNGKNEQRQKMGYFKKQYVTENEIGGKKWKTGSETRHRQKVESLRRSDCLGKKDVITSVTRCWNKSGLILPKTCPKSSHKIDLKVSKYLGYFCTEICHHELLKIAQSGHTGYNIPTD